MSITFRSEGFVPTIGALRVYQLGLSLGDDENKNPEWDNNWTPIPATTLTQFVVSPYYNSGVAPFLEVTGPADVSDGGYLEVTLTDYMPKSSRYWLGLTLFAYTENADGLASARTVFIEFGGDEIGASTYIYDDGTGGSTGLGSVMTPPTNRPVTIRFSLVGGNLYLFVNGAQVADMVDPGVTSGPHFFISFFPDTGLPTSEGLYLPKIGHIEAGSGGGGTPLGNTPSAPPPPFIPDESASSGIFWKKFVWTYES